MKLSEYLSVERGRGSSIALILNVAPQQIYQWASGSRGVPIDRCVGIEQATGGEVSRKDLRPKDWQEIWPELAALPDPSDSTPDCHTPDTSIPGTPVDGAKVREAKNGTRKVPTDVKGVMS